MPNYGEAPLNDHAWLTARASLSGFTLTNKLPAYGVAMFSQNLSYNSVKVLDLQPPTAAASSKVLVVNGPRAFVGIGNVLIHDRPVKCAVEVQGVSTFIAGSIWGPVGTTGYAVTDPGCWKLHPGLGGFRCVESAPTSGRTWAWFVRDSYTPLWAKVTSNWWDQRLADIPYVTARPSVDMSGGVSVYDGSLTYRPAISFDIYLPRIGNGGAVTAAANPQDPNVRTNDVIQYVQVHDGFTSGPSAKFNAVGPYLDAKVGMAMMWPKFNGNIPATRPRGWGLMDGTENATALGGSGRDLRGRFLVTFEDRNGGSVPAHSDANYDMGNTGGSLTHTHTAHGTNAVQSGAGITVVSGQVERARCVSPSGNSFPKWQRPVKCKSHNTKLSG